MVAGATKALFNVIRQIIIIIIIITVGIESYLACLTTMS